MPQRKFPPIIFVFKDERGNANVLMRPDSKISQDDLNQILTDCFWSNRADNKKLLENAQVFNVPANGRNFESQVLENIDKLNPPDSIKKKLNILHSLSNQLNNIPQAITNEMHKAGGCIIVTDDAVSVDRLLDTDLGANTGGWMRSFPRPVCMVNIGERDPYILYHEIVGHYGQYLEMRLNKNHDSQLIEVLLALDYITNKVGIGRELMKRLLNSDSTYDVREDFIGEGNSIAMEDMGSGLEDRNLVYRNAKQAPRPFTHDDSVKKIDTHFARYHFDITLPTIRVNEIFDGLMWLPLGDPRYSMTRSKFYDLSSQMQSSLTIDGSGLGDESKEMVNGFLADLRVMLQTLSGINEFKNRISGGSDNARNAMLSQANDAIENELKTFQDKWSDKASDLSAAAEEWLKNASRVHRLARFGLTEERGQGFNK